MSANIQINIPTPIGPVQLRREEIFSFSRDENGGTVIILKEMAGDTRLEIISGFPYKDFKEWYNTYKEWVQLIIQE